MITNDYAAPNPYKKGYPEGHVEIRRHLNIPVFDGDRIVAVAGVGNKDEDYDESDVRQLTLLMNGMWWQIKRQRAEDPTSGRWHRQHCRIGRLPSFTAEAEGVTAVDLVARLVAEADRRLRL